MGGRVTRPVWAWVAVICCIVFAEMVACSIGLSKGGEMAGALVVAFAVTRALRSILKDAKRSVIATAFLTSGFFFFAVLLLVNAVGDSYPSLHTFTTGDAAVLYGPAATVWLVWDLFAPKTAQPRETSKPRTPSQAEARPEGRSCGSCGAQNDSDARHCDACGRPLVPPRCADCGALNRAEAIHCKGCGRALGA